MSRLKRTLADFFQQADLVLLGLCCAATLFGIALIISATQYLEEVRMIIRYAGVQAAGMLLGICAYIFLSVVDLDGLMKKWKWIVLFNIVLIGLLLTPLGIGKESTGNQAWLKIPGIPFQIGPAEVVKITFTLLLAKQLEWLREEKRDLKSFRSAFLVAGHALALIGWYVVVSGDMGNALTFFFIFLFSPFSWPTRFFPYSLPCLAPCTGLPARACHCLSLHRLLFALAFRLNYASSASAALIIIAHSTRFLCSSQPKS